MKKIRVYISASLLLILCTLFSACADDLYGYRVLETVGSENLALAFRAGDPISRLVPAAMRELKASGKAAELAIKWFGEDLTLISPEEGAVEAVLAELEMETLAAREFILGVDVEAAPYSMAQGRSFSGFDVELARAVCEELGWKLKIQPISPKRAETELAAGNIDCAWGGQSFPEPSDAISVSEPYLTAAHLLLAKSDSGPGRVKNLNGGIIFMRDDIEIINSMERSPELADINFEKRFQKDIVACFAALDNGDCDAIIVDEFALKYQLTLAAS